MDLEFHSRSKIECFYRGHLIKQVGVKLACFKDSSFSCIRRFVYSTFKIKESFVIVKGLKSFEKLKGTQGITLKAQKGPPIYYVTLCTTEILNDRKMRPLQIDF